ncbi:hypothetical protein CsatA_025236 [Cannabis sativa]
MAKTRARQRKLKSELKKPKKRGPTSTADVRKTKMMDSVIGVEPINFLEEEGDGEPEQSVRAYIDLFQAALSLKFSQQAIKRQEEIRKDFDYFLQANRKCSASVLQVRRVWKGKVDKVGSLSYGVFLVRFETIEARDEILNGGYVFFNNRPVVMKAWDPEVNFKKEDIRLVPILIQLPDLELKYWDERSIFKIVGQLGTPLQVDTMTEERNNLNYPCVLIEVAIQQDFPECIPFEVEHGFDVFAFITYEWKPIIYNHCQGLGHPTAYYKKK